MALTETARKNHDELFPGQLPALAITDPELVEIFNNFSFDETRRYGNLDIRTRLMVQLASLIACQGMGEYRTLVGAALTVGVTPVQIKEVVYQAVPYVGMAKVSDFLTVTNQVLTDHGVELPLTGQSTTTLADRAERGLSVQKVIAGPERVEAMRAAAAGDEKHFQDYLAGNCFGDYLTRGGLDVATRELLTLSMLVSLGGCEPQVKGHIQGNLNVGNDRARMLEVINALLPYIGYPRTLNALRVLNDVVPAH
ncbi:MULTISPECIES: carboxymuconolactone decarboxylase family protein [unclassified Arthrobacter]|uniref:carboxymuconolactone decarboxylase family protein n=1 Tax=unclassified Arthrobacter TaxID=235627 RepID=UPI002882DC27|nr:MULTISPECIES: carboxymuconolactone decarboxylase family protein [unclassified Arthrobacter]